MDPRGCKNLAHLKNLLCLGRDSPLVADAQMWRQTCGFGTLVFSLRSLSFCRQKLTLPSLLLHRALLQPLTGWERKARKENPWFRGAPAWASRCAGHLASLILSCIHRNPENKHPHLPHVSRREGKGPERSPDLSEAEWGVSGETGTCMQRCSSHRLVARLTPQPCLDCRVSVSCVTDVSRTGDCGCSYFLWLWLRGEA